MDLTALTDWCRSNPGTAAIALGPSAAVLLLLVAGLARTLARRLQGRLTVPVAVPAIGAVLATGLSADTAWRFAAERMDITELWERSMIFAVGEVALFSFALGARANLHNPEKRRTGTDGVMVWVTCALLAIPAWSVSDSLAAAAGRLIFGPLAAAVLWHKAMGIELKHTRPSAQDEGLLATLGRDLRERLLARMGLATRDLTAQQIAQKRAIIKTAVLSERYHDRDPKQTRRRAWTMRRLRRAELKADVATDEEAREQVLEVRAHLQHAAGPKELSSPYTGRSGGKHRTAFTGARSAPNPGLNAGVTPAPNSSEPLPVGATEPLPLNPEVRSFPRPLPDRTHGSEHQHGRAEQPEHEVTERPGGREVHSAVNPLQGAVPPQVSAPNSDRTAPVNDPFTKLPPESANQFGGAGEHQAPNPGEQPPRPPVNPEPNRAGSGSPNPDDGTEPNSEDGSEPNPNEGGEPPNSGDENSSDPRTLRDKIEDEWRAGTAQSETVRRLGCSKGYVSTVYRELNEELEKKRAREHAAAR